MTLLTELLLAFWHLFINYWLSDNYLSDTDYCIHLIV